MSTQPIRVAVLGVTGYAGAELARLLLDHPGVGSVRLLARSEVGRRLDDLFPHLALAGDSTIEALGDPAEVAARLAGETDAAFLALPHGASAPLAAALARVGLVVLDLSADLRLASEAVYRDWYGEHPAPALLGRAVYGLPERNREALATADLIACPGCYPTATLLATLPLLEAGLVEGDVIADCKSGVSGAGRGAKVTSILPEAGEQLSPYAVAAHRHEPEIAQEMGRAAGREITLTFTPHLVPMSRGILATAYLSVAGAPGERELRALYRERYEGHPFVTVLPEGRMPSTGMVRGSNRAVVGVTRHPRSGRVIALAAIDNLLKGAAGQAVQCMNLRFGLSETVGLARTGLFP